MNAPKKQLFSPFFLFAVILLIPLLILVIHNGSKLSDIYIIHPDHYTITKAKLLTNYHRKYNNRATYQFTNDGKTVEGSAGSILWGSIGDEVTIYFEKNNIQNNGILSGLYFLSISQWLLLIVFSIYVVFKIVRHARTP